ncbi:FKBP-type peptidyl-prolyl cis-trans isomerase [Flaviaesturariibacter amylovorans]
MLKTLIASLLALTVFAGCIKGRDEVRCQYDACAVKATNAEIDSVRAYLAANNITDAIQHCSGVFYRITVAGTGAQPEPCSFIGASYTGRRVDGSVFDAGTFPQPYQLTALIRGWTNILPLVKTGGEVILYIPPSLGYGGREIRDANNNLVLAANSMLIFTVQLTSVQ